LAVTELLTTPAVIPVTFTENVQCAPAFRDAPARLIVVDPATAVTVPLSQVPATGGLATCKPPVNVSVKLMPVKAPDEFGFVTVKLNVVVPPTGMVAAPKLFVIVGGPSTVKLAVDVLPVPALEETVTELLIAPAVFPVTLTENVQLTPAASVAPARVTEDDPAVAVMVPPSQLPVIALGVDTTRPPVNVSVKPIAVKLVDVFGFVMVKLKVVLPPTGMLAGPKVLVMFAFAAIAGLMNAEPTSAANSSGKCFNIRFSSLTTLGRSLARRAVQVCSRP
jgi:hypothetical protein